MGTVTRKEKERDIRKKDIIDAAEKVFFSKGFNNSTMDDVAKEAEFSKRTVYVYFRSKEQLRFEIMLRGYRLLNSTVEKAIDKNSFRTGIEKIRLLAEIFLAFNKSHKEYFRAIMDYENGDMDFESKDDDSIKECYSEGEKLLDFLKDALNEGIKEGTISQSIDLTSTALVLWGSIVGVLNISQRKEKYLIRYHNRNMEKVVEEAINLLIRSIKN